jgi:hypothetical protein
MALFGKIQRARGAQWEPRRAVTRYSRTEQRALALQALDLLPEYGASVAEQQVIAKALAYLSPAQAQALLQDLEAESVVLRRVILALRTQLARSGTEPAASQRPPRGPNCGVGVGQNPPGGPSEWLSPL